MKIRITPKPASEAQKRARERNWNKGQIISLRMRANNVRKAKTTRKDEKIILEIMINDLNKILRNWTKLIEE